jgi:hypothetical protein
MRTLRVDSDDIELRRLAIWTNNLGLRPHFFVVNEYVPALFALHFPTLLVSHSCLPPACPLDSLFEEAGLLRGLLFRLVGAGFDSEGFALASPGKRRNALADFDIAVPFQRCQHAPR